MAKTRAGKMDKRIRLQPGSPVVTASGASSVVYKDLSYAPAIWAEVEQLPGGGEIDEAGRFQPRGFWRVRIRRRAGIDSNARIAYGSRMLYIREISDDHLRSPFMEILCTEYPE